MTAASCRCGATWTGSRLEHCPVCHSTFNGTRAGDLHRTGDHAISIGPDRRRCLTVDEMLVKGMTQNERGYWSQGDSRPSFWQLERSSERPADYDWGPVPLKIPQALEDSGDVT